MSKIKIEIKQPLLRRFQRLAVLYLQPAYSIPAVQDIANLVLKEWVLKNIRNLHPDNGPANASVKISVEPSVALSLSEALTSLALDDALEDIVRNDLLNAIARQSSFLHPQIYPTRA